MATAKELESDAKKLEKDGKIDDAITKYNEAAAKYESDGDDDETNAKKSEGDAKTAARFPNQHELAENLYKQASRQWLDAKKKYFKAAEMHINAAALLKQKGGKKDLTDAVTETNKGVTDIENKALPFIDKAGDDYAAAAAISEGDAASLKAKNESGYESEYMEAMHQREEAAAMYNMAALMWALLSIIYKKAKMGGQSTQATTNSNNEKTKVKQQRDKADQDLKDAQ